ncbi:MAG: ArsR family transcriptional regulator [Actinomycetota bacterium]
MTAVRTLHDLSTVRPRRLRIEVDSSPIYDLLLTMWSTFGGDDKPKTHALGQNWFNKFRTRLSDRTIELANQVSPHGELWAALIPVVELAPGEHSIEAVLTWLDGADPVDIRTKLLAEKFWDVETEVLEAAAAADPDAIASVLAAAARHEMNSEFCQSLESFLELPAERVLPLLTDVLRRVREEAFVEVEEEWAAAQKRDAEAKRLLIGAVDSATDLIETITNGIAYELPLGTRRLILVPSVSLRPWTLITDRDDALIVCYPVAEENLVHDPDAPPTTLLAVYRALGDERRLRLLRRLADSPSSLAELTEYLGLAKSTVFHHIGVLRSAGLVRVQLSAGGKHSTYSLRLDSIPDQRAIFDQYLSPPAVEKAEGAGR